MSITHAQSIRPDTRTGLIELSEPECWARLEAHGTGRLAVVNGTTPDIFPVNYVVHRGEILIRTEAGTKLAAATLMPAVAFEIDEFDPRTRTGWSVVVKGHGREPKTLDELVDLDDLGIDPWVEASKSRWLAIQPQGISGREVPPSHPAKASTTG
jgi:nitroimidazol reductase NimA-like FMN-containing flavoprotein (pyridoxamine 5'-phosphate oxidase superfamily)